MTSFLALTCLIFAAVLSASFLLPKNDQFKENSINVDKVPFSSFPIVLVWPIRASGLSESQSELAKGFTESTIATLASYDGVTVLSSSTSYYAQKRQMLDEELKREFAVDHVIRGSIQVVEKKGRLNLEITDVKTGKVIGSQQRDFDLSEIFVVQDQMSIEILKDMQINVGNSGSATAKKIPFNNMDDYTAFKLAHRVEKGNRRKLL